MRPVFNSRKIIDDLKVVEAKPPLIKHIALFINFHVICAIQIMSDKRIHPDISLNASLNINILLLVNT